MTFFGDMELAAILLGLLAFVIVYSAAAPWWRSVAGRHVMAFMSAALIIVAIRVSRMIFGEYPGAPTLRAIGLGLVVIVVYWRVILVIRTQLNPSHREKKVDEVKP